MSTDEGTQDRERRIVGGRFLKYDVTDWPLVISWLPLIPNKEDPTEADMLTAEETLMQVMHVAKFGTDGNEGLPGFELTGEACEIRKRLHGSLQGLSCGPITTILNLTGAYLPSWRMVPHILKLVRLSESEQKGCLTERIVVVPEHLYVLVNGIVSSLEHVTATFVSSTEEAYKRIAESAGL